MQDKCSLAMRPPGPGGSRYDKRICIYEFDKLDKPKEAVQRISRCHAAAIVSMAYDHTNNCILTGSIDGSMKVWSMEGR